MRDSIRIYLQSLGVPLLSKFQASNNMAIRFSSRAYCRDVIKMEAGEGINEERLKVRALVGEHVVASGGELGLCPVLSWPYSIPKPPVTAGTSDPRSWKRMQRV